MDILPEALQETVEQLQGEGITVIGCPTDTTDQLQVDALPETVEVELRPANILINNAGTFSVIVPVWEVDPQRWFRNITTNLYGTFLCCAAFVRESWIGNSRQHRQ